MMMTMETKILLETALKGKTLYHTSQLTYEQAKELVQPYVTHFNRRSVEASARTGIFPETISIEMFMR